MSVDSTHTKGGPDSNIQGFLGTETRYSLSDEFLPG